MSLKTASKRWVNRRPSIRLRYVKGPAAHRGASKQLVKLLNEPGDISLTATPDVGLVAAVRNNSKPPLPRKVTAYGQLVVGHHRRSPTRLLHEPGDISLSVDHLTEPGTAARNNSKPSISQLIQGKGLHRSVGNGSENPRRKQVKPNNFGGKCMSVFKPSCTRRRKRKRCNSAAPTSKSTSASFWPAVPLNIIKANGPDACPSGALPIEPVLQT